MDAAKSLARVHMLPPENTNTHTHACTKALILTVFIPDTKTVKDIGLVGGQCRISFLEGVFPAPMTLFLGVA